LGRPPHMRSRACTWLSARTSSSGPLPREAPPTNCRLTFRTPSMSQARQRIALDLMRQLPSRPLYAQVALWRGEEGAGPDVQNELRWMQSRSAAGGEAGGRRGRRGLVGPSRLGGRQASRLGLGRRRTLRGADCCGFGWRRPSGMHGGSLARLRTSPSASRWCRWAGDRKRGGAYWATPSQSYRITMEMVPRRPQRLAGAFVFRRRRLGRAGPSAGLRRTRREARPARTRIAAPWGALDARVVASKAAPGR
jgi:hypothetical protein